jgi:hypothetical protein
MLAPQDEGLLGSVMMADDSRGRLILCELAIVLFKQVAILAGELPLQCLDDLFTFSRRHLAPCFAGRDAGSAQSCVTGRRPGRNA